MLVAVISYIGEAGNCEVVNEIKKNYQVPFSDVNRLGNPLVKTSIAGVMDPRGKSFVLPLKRKTFTHVCNAQTNAPALGMKESRGGVQPEQPD